MVPQDLVHSRLFADSQGSVGHQVVQHLAEFFNTRTFDDPAGNILNLVQRQRPGYTTRKTADD